MGKTSAQTKLDDELYIKSYAELEAIVNNVALHTGDAIEHVRERLSIGTEQRAKERDGTEWHEFVHEESKRLKKDPDPNDPAPTGKSEFMPWLSKRSKGPFNELSREDRKALLERRKTRLALTASKPYALTLRAKNRRQESCIKAVQKDLERAQRAYGLESICVAVNPDGGSSFGATSVGSRKGTAFLKEIFGIPLVEFMRLFEAFGTSQAVTSSKVYLKYNTREPAVIACAAYILRSLQEATDNRAAKMKYTNIKVLEKEHSVKLLGWPDEASGTPLADVVPFQSPSSIKDIPTVKRLLEACSSGTIRFIRVSCE